MIANSYMLGVAAGLVGGLMLASPLRELLTEIRKAWRRSHG
jgi:hypothetical protein